MVSLNNIQNILKQFLVLTIISWTSPVYSNNPRIINIYREDYRADNKNWAIGQDERGTMYFGNDAGLLEFDGIEWRMNELPNKLVVRSLSVLSHNTVFTGSYEEFGRWDRDISGKLAYTSLSRMIDRSLFQNDDFWRIWATDTLVYFQSFTSIYVYDYRTIRQIPSEQGFLFLQKVRNEFLVQQMLGVIYRLNGLRLQSIEGSEIFKNTDVRVILPYHEKEYLIGTAEKGIYLYDGQSFKEWNRRLSGIVTDKELNCGIRTSNGLYYFGTISGGIYVTDEKGNVLNQISSENTLQNNTVLALLEDDSGNIWAALDRGISCINYLDNMSYYTDPGGSLGAVYSAALWNNELYIATNHGVLYIDKTDLERLNSLHNLKLINGTQGQAWMLKVVHGRLYCCHNKGLKEIHADHSTNDISGINTGVYNLTEVNLKAKNLLFLSTYNSLKIMDETGKIHAVSQIREPIRDMAIDHLGNVWLEHANKGIYRCKPNTANYDFQSISLHGGDNSDGLPYQLKMFKVGGRIELLGNDSFYTYNDVEDKIILNKPLNQCFKHIKNLKQIITIGDNTFWALTDHSIYRFFYDGYNASIIEDYNLGQDILLVNRNENISILNDSIHLICLDNGFLLYKPPFSKQADSYRKEAPCIESVQVMNAAGKSKYIDRNVDTEISYKNNHIVFYFSAKNTFTDHLLFQYQLTGIDRNWSAPQKINSVAYARLPKGKYEFKVRACDHSGNYSSNSVYRFEITPPWFLTVWAYLAYLLLGISGLYAGRALILKKYRNKHLQKVKNRETRRLKVAVNKLQHEIVLKNAELLSQASFIIQKNELIEKMKILIQEFYSKNKNNSLIPLYQKINSLLDNDLNSEEDWNHFLIKFEEKHAGFFKNLKQRYPQLTNTDLRLCACLKLNMETKEIASLMNISVRAVENNRYRLRKKLNIQSSQNLNDFFLCEEFSSDESEY